MHLAFSGAKPGGASRHKITRLTWISAGGSQAFRLLHGCPVVAADGALLGKVDGLIIDARSHKPRFVTLRGTAPSTAVLAIPWQSLYFDSTLAHLVFYTFG